MRFHLLLRVLRQGADELREITRRERHGSPLPHHIHLTAYPIGYVKADALACVSFRADMLFLTRDGFPPQDPAHARAWANRINRVTASRSTPKDVA